ncbi:hypothetical protein Poli38472_011400 [Pythium oligandrum]|uniref:Uncharacterized protein n=1 Tax=Pythium oligandrum TaxID=41045 RepID=A0A8K1CKV2_PYTOL|nr:hypothetical protein Poli38472_011400 [Pythium oligandrum]|eukprot:TMW64520.1 hypothetical protein Poli38472_011400 [Pythium oligandrum]
MMTVLYATINHPGAGSSYGLPMHLQVLAPPAPSMGLEKESIPTEAQALKEYIQKTHPHKCFSFSFAHMKHVATPPVAIPNTYSARNGRTAYLVGGHEVPFTKDMWENYKHSQKRHLDAIHECD